MQETGLWSPAEASQHSPPKRLQTYENPDFLASSGQDLPEMRAQSSSTKAPSLQCSKAKPGKSWQCPAESEQLSAPQGEVTFDPLAITPGGNHTPGDGLHNTRVPTPEVLGPDEKSQSEGMQAAADTSAVKELSQFQSVFDFL